VDVDVGAAVFEVLDGHPEYELDTPARGDEALERVLIEELARDSAIGDSRRRSKHLGVAVTDAPSTPAMGDRRLECVWHEIEETPRTVCAAECFAWIDEHDTRVFR